jgi:single-stranded-DNA-specific exonuclease
MNPRLQEYISRFNKDFSYQFDEFFTQYSISDYRTKLPWLVDVGEFCERVGHAIEKLEKVCIYSDYDTDAITATATMYWGLIALGVLPENLSFYAPDRFTEGYGMNTDAALTLSKKYDLVISVDCGINSTKEADIFKKSKCDLIITDHHQLNGEIPDCFAVVNPRLSDIFYQNPALEKTHRIIRSQNQSNWKTSIIRDIKNLQKNPSKFVSSSVTGVGVAWFCLVWLAYYLEESGILISDQPRKNLNKLLPFVAIGTIADCQSVLEPANRLLVRSGLNIIQNNLHQNTGLLALLSQTGILEKITQGYKINSQDLGFVLSPILNSSGRISHANLSISVLLEKNETVANKLVHQLIETNNERKKMVRDIIDSLENEVQNQIAQGEEVVWLSGEWNKGIIGLLASRFVNEYQIPVLITTEEEGKIVGSSRAPEGYNLPLSFEAGKDLFEKAGGHPGAAGFTYSKAVEEKIKIVVKKALSKQKKEIAILQKDMAKAQTTTLPENVQKSLLKKQVLLLDEHEITKSFLEEVSLLDPFGQDFPYPHILFKLSSKEFRWLGQDQKHIKFSIGKELIPCTGFFIEAEKKQFILDFLENKKDLYLLVKMSQNTWNGNTNLELIIEKILV